MSSIMNFRPMCVACPDPRGAMELGEGPPDSALAHRQPADSSPRGLQHLAWSSHRLFVALSGNPVANSGTLVFDRRDTIEETLMDQQVA